MKMLLRHSILRLGKSKFVARNLCGTNYLNAKDGHDGESTTDIKTPDSQETKQKEAKAKLNELLQSMSKESVAPPEESIKLQLAIPKIREKKAKGKAKIRIEPEMLKAVDNVAHTYEPKLRETKKQNLLDKLEAVAVETAENKAASFQREKLQDLLESMEKDTTQDSKKSRVKLAMPDLKARGSPPKLTIGEKKKREIPVYQSAEKKSFIADKQTTEQLNSLLNTLKVDVSSVKKRTPITPKLAPEKVERLYSAQPIGIFKDLKIEDAAPTPKLNTWEKLFERELELTVSHPPANGFQQMIQWTKQGKMWHFPINNEQGLEKEAEVGFHEHVFLEPHLNPWCPKRGPVRHFMELVVVGLSKNPYMTLETKLGHIHWFRDFFTEHQKILVESGAMGEAVSSPKRVSA